MPAIYDAMGGILLLLAIGSCAVAKTDQQSTNGILLVIAAAIFMVGSSLLAELREAKKRSEQRESVTE